MENSAALERHLKALAQKAKGFIGVALRAVADALEEMADAKADKGKNVKFIIPAAGWTKEEVEAGQDDSENEEMGTNEFLYYFDFQVEGITAEDVAKVYIAPSDMAVASICGLCPTCETLAGKIRIRAKAVPQNSIRAEYRIEKGKV